ncbi:MAG: hypothetical protein MZV63_00495 [Marinilabiliales bacterium]|nr:hypothetical protein [Marinilabiliales bacterium]
MIRERLGRDLRPYDIWYDGFQIAAAQYPRACLHRRHRHSILTLQLSGPAMPAMLIKLGWSPERAKYLC